MHLKQPDWRLVDCPGYGFAKASLPEKEQWRKFMQIYLKESTCLQRVLLLIDLNVGPQDSDKLLMDMLIESSRIYSVVFTKVDRCKPKTVQ